jgi:hypothetical protein
MTTKYHYHYLLFLYRQAPPPQRMAALLHELRPPVTAIRGYAQLLSDRVRESDAVSAQTRDFLQGLLDSMSTLDEISVAEIQNTRSISENTLQTSRARILPLINHTTELIARLTSLKHEIEPLCSDIPRWHTAFLTSSNHIWAIVDVLTNPDLEIPSDILYWINNRESFWQEVHQGDARSLNHILNGLTHPEIEIRREAIRLLGQLKHPESFKQLITALTDSEPKVRSETAQALKEFGDRRAIYPLRERLNDEEEFVRSRAKEAIEYLEQC